MPSEKFLMLLKRKAEAGNQESRKKLELFKQNIPEGTEIKQKLNKNNDENEVRVSVRIPRNLLFDLDLFISKGSLKKDRSKIIRWCLTDYLKEKIENMCYIPLSNGERRLRTLP